MSHIADPKAIRPRPHHYMNADGTCHAGDVFEAGTDFVVLYSAEELVRIVNAEKANAWDQCVRSMAYEDGTPVEIVSSANPYAAHREHQ